MNSLKQPLFWGLIGLAIIIALAWTFFSNKKTNQEQAKNTTEQTAENSIVNLTNQEPKNFDAGIKKEYSTAAEKVKLVGTDFKLAAIEVMIGKNLQQDSIQTRYIFNSEQNKANNWMITFNSTTGSYIRALIPTEDYLGVIPQMNAKLWKTNYVTALQVAEKNGGLAWREDNPITGAKATLRSYNEKNPLVWSIEYIGEVSNLLIKVDASNGNIVEG